MKRKTIFILMFLISISSSFFANAMVIDSNENVGIGTDYPTEKLSVNGIIESIGGGIKFPDGTVQITASSGGGGGGGSYVKVAVVAQGGGDYTDPLSALSTVATWCGTPSITNPCLIKIMPGVYNIGANNLQMIPYVDIEGAGENTTKISGNFSNNWWNGVVNGSNSAEIRFLTVENTGGGGTYAIAIAMNNTSTKITNVTTVAYGAVENVGIICWLSCSPAITNLTTISTGGSLTIGVYMADASSPTIINLNTTVSGATRNIGIDMDTDCAPDMSNTIVSATGGSKNHAIHTQRNSTPTITNVRAIASGGTDENFGVFNITGSSPVLMNAIIDASGGTTNYGIYYKSDGYTGGTIRIDHSVIKGTTDAIYYDDASFSVLIGNTRLTGSIIGPGTNKCAGVYDENYIFYANSCP